jgi:hypothetical protein
MSGFHRAIFPSIFALAMQVTPQAATEPPVIPADQSAEIYDVYSALIDHPKLSHSDTATKYLIGNSTGFNPDPSLAGCVTPTSAYRSSFEEILAAFAAHKFDSFRLERKFTLSRPYEILDPAEVKQFEEMTMKPSLLGGSRDDVDKFRGGTDIIQVGNVYFNRNRTFAMVRTGAWCGGLCGLWVWRILEKDASGGWRELSRTELQNWRMCATIA